MPKLFVQSNESQINYDSFWGVPHLFNTQARKSAWGSRAVPIPAVPITAALPVPEAAQGWVLGRAADKSQNAGVFQTHLYSSCDFV